MKTLIKESSFGLMAAAAAISYSHDSYIGSSGNAYSSGKKDAVNRLVYPKSNSDPSQRRLLLGPCYLRLLDTCQQKTVKELDKIRRFDSCRDKISLSICDKQKVRKPSPSLSYTA